jgi:hypothetical protein
VPKAGSPRTKPGTIKRADGFRRAGRYLTWRRPRRRIPPRTRGSGSVAKPSFAAAAKRVLVPSLKTHVAGKATSPPPATARSGNVDDRNSSAPGDALGVSADFRSEFAALLAFYAARIAAARASLDPSIATAIVQALLNQQTTALRALTDRWHAATQKQWNTKEGRQSEAAMKFVRLRRDAPTRGLDVMALRRPGAVSAPAIRRAGWVAVLDQTGYGLT